MKANPFSRLRRFAVKAILATLILMGATRVQAVEADIVTLFNFNALETPESVAVDFFGNRYVSLALTGEIRKIAPNGQESTHAQLPLGAPLTTCGPLPVFMTALAIDLVGNIYTNVNSCEVETRGVYKVRPNGQYEKIASLPFGGLFNGIALHLGKLYIAESLGGFVYRVPATGGQLEVWADHPSLKQIPNEFGAPGPNGLQFYLNELYVANSSTGQILAFPLRLNGKAGAPRIHAQIEDGSGCDDFAFDIEGTLYCGTDPYNTVVKIPQNGEPEVILTAEDGLNGPTAMTFGRLWDRNILYITNAAFPFFPGMFQPSLMEVELDVPGYPLR